MNLAKVCVGIELVVAGVFAGLTWVDKWPYNLVNLVVAMAALLAAQQIYMDAKERGWWE